MQSKWGNDEFSEDGVAASALTETGGTTERGLRFNKFRDLPLLLEIRNATFLSHRQLYDLMAKAGTEYREQALYWRMNRFIKGKYVGCFGSMPPYEGRIYFMTRLGLGVLESFGEGLLGFGSGSKNMPNRNQAPHFLELNEIRKAFSRTGMVTRWQSERQLTSRNYVIGSPLAKDYDAVADISYNGTNVRVAIEYERTDKAYARYQVIQRSLRSESQVDLLLYLTSQFEQVLRISAEFTDALLPMAFVPARSFCTHLFSAVSRFAFREIRRTIPVSDAIEVAISVQI